MKWNDVWTPGFAKKNGFKPLNLDFYQTHYYPWMDGPDQKGTYDPKIGQINFSPMKQNFNQLKLDKPMIVGEFQQNMKSGLGDLKTLKDRGYAGAWAWSARADFPIDYQAYKEFSKQNSHLRGAALLSLLIANKI